MNANKYKTIDHQVNYVEHRAVEVFPVTWLIGSKYLFLTMVTVSVLGEFVRN